MAQFSIAERLVGEQQPCYIVAEMSANHAGSLERAKAIINAAKQAGADAVKLQTYTADSLTLDCQQADFLLPENSPWAEYKNFYQLYQKAAMPWHWHQALFDYATELGIAIFSSPFDHDGVTLLTELDCVAYKVASPEITDIPLIEAIAKTGKPVVFSTGLAEKEDIERAITAMLKHGNEQFAFLKCTTAYPAPLEQANLLQIKQMATDFNCVVGLSDHCIGEQAVIAAIALGAKIIEKHITLDDGVETPDSFFSLTASQFTDMVRTIRAIEQGLGDGSYQLTPAAKANLKGRRSLYVAKDMAAGEVFTQAHIKSVRPSYGLHPKYYSQVLGAVAKKALRKGDRLSLDDFEREP